MQGRQPLNLPHPLRYNEHFMTFPIVRHALIEGKMQVHTLYYSFTTGEHSCI